MSTSEAGKGSKNNRIDDWKAYYNAPIWDILEKKKEKIDSPKHPDYKHEGNEPDNYIPD